MTLGTIYSMKSVIVIFASEYLSNLFINRLSSLSVAKNPCEASMSRKSTTVITPFASLSQYLKANLKLKVGLVASLILTFSDNRSVYKRSPQRILRSLRVSVLK